MHTEIEALFVYGNFWLDDKTLKSYVDAADKFVSEPTTAFLINKEMREIVSKKRAELDMILFLKEKFPDSVALKILGYYVEKHIRELTKGK